MKYLTKFLIAPTIEKNHSFRINLQVGGIREEFGCRARGSDVYHIYPRGPTER